VSLLVTVYTPEDSANKHEAIFHCLFPFFLFCFRYLFIACVKTVSSLVAGSMSQTKLKVALLGDGSVGKRSRPQHILCIILTVVRKIVPHHPVHTKIIYETVRTHPNYPYGG